MKRLITCVFFLLFGIFAVAQNSSEEEKVKQVVNTFFEGFHARDSIIMKSVFYKDPVVQTIGKTKVGETKLVNEQLEKVLKGIVAIPLETEFKEVLHDYVIKIDGDMANAWTPYSFYLNDTFSHCGVNNFQLLKQNEEWKIIYLIDTRRREGCEERKVK
ncbi:Putative lumazine-binding [Salinimicrobium sediminis]|uniref:Lumazine-binding n=1 Tax=Salinimicrobium sediminis TaxID=1343891 RepID=A0A285X5V5_9FLAO|nr:nuclear transport factor 2 family protein [Salinimicrobium sediminis]MDX1754101.1 nuclear transport factor 2 family protein [Salinimicrobium sediminis]SOC80396.1 Putative lumazine-binding [Salinimicrobium sediminis]